MELRDSVKSCFILQNSLLFMWQNIISQTICKKNFSVSLLKKVVVKARPEKLNKFVLVATDSQKSYSAHNNFFFDRFETY